MAVSLFLGQANCIEVKRMSAKEITGSSQVTPNQPEHRGSRRNQEERAAENHTEHAEKTLDKTLADSFPTSDPPSSIPNPSGERATNPSTPALDAALAELAPGTWAAVSIQDQRVVGAGSTREQAEQQAKEAGYSALRLVQAPTDADAPLQAPDAA